MSRRVSVARLSMGILALFSASFTIAAALYPPTAPLCTHREPLQKLVEQTLNIATFIAARNSVTVLLYHLVARLKPKLALALLHVQVALQGFIAGAGYMPYILRVCTVAPHLVPELLSLAFATASGIERNVALLTIAIVLTSIGALVETTLTPRLCLQAIQC